MIEIKVYGPIASAQEGAFFSALGVENAVFSAETVRKIFDDNPEETDFKFNIHCDGGSTAEGFAIYDLIRNSGKNIYTNIEGGCHSMAIILLLSAPPENRTANPNCRALIHKVYIDATGQSTVDELRNMADLAETEQNAILDIYEERTGCDRATLETLMRAEKSHTASELLEYGFISRINQYNTNYKPKKRITMNERQEVLNSADTFLGKLKNFLSGKPAVVNFDFTDADGNVMFSTQKEDESIEVGDPASPDGTFTLPDGRTVTITEGVVESIDEEDIENLRNEVGQLRNDNAELRNMLEQSQTQIVNLKEQITSNYTPAKRTSTPKVPANQKADVLAKLKKK